jgi:hypothetical protein
MAAGDSIVGICNLGLVNGLGQDPIASLTDNRKAAIHCNLAYDPTRRAMLRAHPWDFATARARLSASGHRAGLRLRQRLPAAGGFHPHERDGRRYQSGKMEDRKGFL